MRIVGHSAPDNIEPRALITVPKAKPKDAPALPEILKIEGNWKDAMRKLISKKRPEGGWPKPER